MAPTARAGARQAAAPCGLPFRLGGGIGTLVVGTHQSRGTPMEWWQVMGDHRRVEVRNVHEVRYYPRAALQGLRSADATCSDGEDTLVWEPNMTAAANEDHKGYHALLGDFGSCVKSSEPLVEVPIDCRDGAKAVQLLEQAIRRNSCRSPLSLFRGCFFLARRIVRGGNRIHFSARCARRGRARASATTSSAAARG